jgi:hypothetical protein
MGCIVIRGAPGAKGPIPYWLDRLSIGPDARARLEALLNALRKLAPSYQGLEDVFDASLAARFAEDDTFRQRLHEHLKQRWFSDSPDSFFPGQQVAEKYGEAVIKTVELSLGGKPHPVPISAWWIIQADKDVRMLNLADVNRDGVTVSSSVTLLICTPVPPPAGAPTNRSLFGDAEIWLTEQQTGAVITRRMEKEVRNP